MYRAFSLKVTEISLNRVIFYLSDHHLVVSLIMKFNAYLLDLKEM